MSSPLTIVVLSRSDVGGAVAEVLQSWSGEGLLHDMVVIGVDDKATAVEPTHGQLVVGGVASEVDVLEVVAVRDLSILRLLRLRVVDGEADVGPDPATEALASRLSNRIADLHQDLVRLNVVVPVRDDTPIPAESLKPLWQANVIVSPEDRLTERHLAAKVENRLAAHSALAVTTAGGLWSQMADAPFDRPAAEQGSFPQSALIARSWARVLVGGGALREVVDQVFGIRRTQPDTLARAASGVVTRDAQLVTARATAAFLANADGGTLNYREPEPLPPPAEITVGLLTALKMMFGFLWAGMRSLPGLVRDSATRAVQGKLESAVQSMTFGRDSAVATSYSGRRGAPVASGQAADPALAVRQYAQGLLSAMEMPEVPAATPATWRELRAVVFGLHDGGNLPPYVEAPVSGAVREIVTDLEALAATPSDAPVLLADHVAREDAGEQPMRTPLRECDPFQAEVTRTWMEQRLAGTTAEAADGEQTTPEPISDERRDGLERALTVLDDWVRRRATTPGWRVAEHLMQQIQTAVGRLEQSMSVLAKYAEPDDSAAQLRARSILKRWWYTILAISFVLVLWWWIAHRLAERENPIINAIGDYGVSLGWRILVTTVVVGLIAFFLAFVRYQREMFRLAHRHNRRVYEFRVAVRGAQHDSREVVRLAAQFEQARDWGQVLAWMLHRPEGPRDDSAAPARTPASLATPLALTRAAGQATPASLRRVAAQVANDRFQRGWLSELYGEYVDQSMAALAHERGLDPGSVRFDPDVDVVDPKRAYLAEAVREGVPAQRWRTAVSSDARNHLARTNPEDLFPEVVHLDDSQPGKVVPAQQFLNDIVPSSGAVDGTLPLLATFWARSAINSARHRTSAVHVWLPPAVQAEAVGGGLSTHPLEVSPRGDDSFMLQAVRVDVAGPVAWTDVATEQVEPTSAVPVDSGVSEGGAL